MKPFYREATFADALEVSLDLRPEDRQEIEGLGQSPLILPACVHTSRESVAFFDSDGSIAGVGGISPDPANSAHGLVWLLCTPVITNMPHTFVRGARRWLSEHEHKYELLWNLVDARNHFHHKLLKMLGFKALRVVNTKPYFLPYLEIVKICAYQL
jgi:hypothetical protein